PLATDTLIAEGYLARVRDGVPADLDVLLLPVQPVGKSDEHDAFPGTLSLETGTALAAWTGIGAAVHRAGCRKLVIVTSHGGNSALIDLVAGELRARFGMVA
ncbi:creatininase family protein, partial [Escherichia coli]|nr:creatininase family protein [Escherichia coli]